MGTRDLSRAAAAALTRRHFLGGTATATLSAAAVGLHAARLCCSRATPTQKRLPSKPSGSSHPSPPLRRGAEGRGGSVGAPTNGFAGRGDPGEAP